MKPASRIAALIDWSRAVVPRFRAPPIHAASLVLLGSVFVFWLWAGLSGWVALVWGAGGAIWFGLSVFGASAQPISSNVWSGRRTNVEDVDAVLEQIVSALPDPAAVATRDGTVIVANALAQDTLGLKPGRRVGTVVRAPEFATAYSEAGTADALRTAEFRLGSPIERRLSARILPQPVSADGSDRGDRRMFLVFRDRTAEAQLDQMRSDFVANASHELRTPLASLKGFIETLQSAAKDDPIARAKFLDIMEQEAGRMSRLIDDLLSLSRAEMRAHVVPRDTIDVTALVTEVADLLRPIAVRNGQSISAIQPDTLVSAIGDRDDLVQVVQNLAQNAIKYGKRGGHVILSVAVEGPHVRIEVSDDGIGIAAEHIPRLTERFYRVSAKDSRERGGTGLGLAIVKHIVNRHRGELLIESKLGTGTTATVKLPRDGTGKL